MSDASEVQIKLLYSRIFDLFCEDNEIPRGKRDKVDATKFVRWLMKDYDGLPLIDRLRQIQGEEISESVYDATMSAIASEDAPLYFFHLFPFLSLGHRTCNPPVTGVEMNLAIRYADGIVVQHPPIGVSDPSGSGACHDGALCMAFNKMASALIKWIRTSSLQKLHDQVVHYKPQAATVSSDGNVFRDQLISLARQPLQGGFA